MLHFLSTQAFASPFDVNMAVDAGFKVVVPHTNAGLEHTTGLVQDAIFSRPVEYGCRTGLFIGGKDALLALDMLAAAQAALVPPFQLSAFADPGGSFTTAAAMVALVEDVYRARTGHSLKGAQVAVFGATGVVGFASSIIAAQAGAKVTMTSHIGVKALEPFVRAGRARFGVDLKPVAAGRATDKASIVAKADIVLCAAAAGVRVLTQKQLAKSRRLAVVADVNAVPPSGIEGVELFDRGRLLDGSDVASVGPLAIGDIKYKTQAALFRSMLASRETVMLDFTHAFAKARKLVCARPANP
nr:methylene-tetrahydromethanopterin dehydrogenase N-terminal domain-containing protein [Hyphomicrobium album]